MPPKDIPLRGRVVMIAAGGAHTCAYLDTGSLLCWGTQKAAVRTENEIQIRQKRERERQTDSRLRRVSLLVCAGDNHVGQLGYNDTISRYAPFLALSFLYSPSSLILVDVF